MCAMRVFNVGDVLAAADCQEYFVNTKYAVKNSDTSRTSTTTVSADPDLTLAVDANKSYAVDMTILYTAASGGGDLKFSCAVPAGTIFSGSAVLMPNSGSLTTVAPYQSGAGLLITTSVAATNGGVGAAVVKLSGVLVTSSTSGSMTLNWAQNTSNVTATVVKQGSYMFLRRVA